MADKHYVYAHKRKTDDSIFYVGKGYGSRAYTHTGRNKHWHNTVSKNGYYVEILKDNLAEDEAYELEELVIDVIGLDSLCNYSRGGRGGRTGVDAWNKGLTGFKYPNRKKPRKFSEEHRRKLSEAAKKQHKRNG